MCSLDLYDGKTATQPFYREKSVSNPSMTNKSQTSLLDRQWWKQYVPPPPKAISVSSIPLKYSWAHHHCQELGSPGAREWVSA